LRRDLPDILEDLVGIGFQVTVITNGTKLRADLLKRFDQPSMALSISLDTLDRIRYLKMGVWRRFLPVVFRILHAEYRVPTLPRTFFQDIR
jgi:molybdenum cofactor biosynthesis enzyme MoaA